MSNAKGEVPAMLPDALFDRIAAILDEAQGRVVRKVNSEMVGAYWLIGREIVEALQGGEARAEYGKQVIENLSRRLTDRYGKGFSVANLKNFRQFYQVFPHRGNEICYPADGELPDSGVFSPLASESKPMPIGYPAGSEFTNAFSPRLSWSHYRALMRVEDPRARDFYEREAA